MHTNPLHFPKRSWKSVEIYKSHNSYPGSTVAHQNYTKNEAGTYYLLPVPSRYRYNVHTYCYYLWCVICFRTTKNVLETNLSLCLTLSYHTKSLIVRILFRVNFYQVNLEVYRVLVKKAKKNSQGSNAKFVPWGSFS